MALNAYDSYANHTVSCAICDMRKQQAEKEATPGNPATQESKLCERGLALYKIMRSVEAQLVNQEKQGAYRGRRTRWR